MAVKAIPDGYHTLTPYLVVKGAREAIAFYQKALGATELFSMPGPGRRRDARRAAGRHVAADACGREPADGHEVAKDGRRLAGLGVHLHGERRCAIIKQAEAAGATVTMPATDQFWGDRIGAFEDPFGHQWSVATHTEDVSSEEMESRMKASMA